MESEFNLFDMISFPLPHHLKFIHQNLALLLKNIKKIISSLVTGGYSSNFKIEFSNWLCRIIIWALPETLLSGECLKTLLMKSQHWSRKWFGAVVSWANIDPDICRHMASIDANEFWVFYSTNVDYFIAIVSFSYRKYFLRIFHEWVPIVKNTHETPPPPSTPPPTIHHPPPPHPPPPTPPPPPHPPPPPTHTPIYSNFTLPTL